MMTKRFDYNYIMIRYDQGNCGLLVHVKFTQLQLQFRCCATQTPSKFEEAASFSSKIILKFALLEQEKVNGYHTNRFFFLIFFLSTVFFFFLNLSYCFFFYFFYIGLATFILFYHNHPGLTTPWQQYPYLVLFLLCKARLSGDFFLFPRFLLTRTLPSTIAELRVRAYLKHIYINSRGIAQFLVHSI